MELNLNSKTIIIAFIAVILLVIVLLNFSASGSARIEVAPERFDFGVIPQKTVEHEFQVKNTGNKALEILQVTTSCGCTTAEIDSELIQPNQTAKLIVRFDPNAMAEPVTGKVKRIVYIKSNDSSNPELEIELTAFVEGGA
jgi:hypothetical protein